MKVKLLVNKGDIKKGEIFEARAIPFMFGTAYQCIEGRLMGVSFQPNDVIELDELPLSQSAFDELKQANLMHVENEKAYERKINSLVELVDHKHREITRTKRNLGEINTEYGKLRDEHRLLLVTIEQDMDRKVVLSKDVAEEIRECQNAGISTFSIIARVWDQYLHTDPLRYSPAAKFAHQHLNPFLRALTDGYTVEQTPDEANEAAFRAGMEAIYKEMDELKYTKSINWQTELTDKLIPLIKEIYKH